MTSVTGTRAIDCPMNSDMVITEIDLDSRHGFRLEELGLRRGTTIRVVQRSAFGGRVLARGPERIAVDGGTARRIHVSAEAPQTAEASHPRMGGRA
ncbi:FeoA family protein [uncultured Bifidobacterium sp.]|uniref:FeoA family protein n=1 Tax=uncultured Bifidobacterium sp. TaxID=165187 RepID=UPI0028DAFBBD|nr:FeoA family protein [uncultured Bifidobacterium sp.]